jgi:tetratricopeptide (TPR) repeat protein
MVRVRVASACILLVSVVAVRPLWPSVSRGEEIQNAPNAASDAPAQLGLPAEMRGDLLMAHQQYAAAIGAYRLGPRDSAALWNKTGIAYHHLFAIDQAKQSYQRALSLKPDYAEAINNLGTIYYGEKKFHQAEKLYRRAVKLSPQAASIYANLGAVYFAEKKFSRGTEAFQTAFAIDPTVFAADSNHQIAVPAAPAERALQDYCMAALFAQAGVKDRAIQYLRKALSEGFNDQKRLREDRQFAGLRGTAEFAQLMAEEKLQ